MNSKYTRYLIAAAIFTYYFSSNYGYLRSRIAGMPYGIREVDRQSLEIPEIPDLWQRFPKENPLSRMQIWINIDTVVPNHYAKLIRMDGASYRDLVIEEDRYVLEADATSQTDLVMTVNHYSFKEGNEFRYCEIDRVQRSSIHDYMHELNQAREPLRSLTYEEALTLLKDKGLR